MHDSTSPDNYRQSTGLALSLLTAVYFFNFVDRQIIGILLEPIRQELAIPDWQLGLIMGLGFGLFYTTVGIPLAWLADRVDRVWVICVALGFWSSMTMLCGAAQNASHLFLARIGVGLGEAGGSPPSHSIISDLYPPERRAGALSIWALGSPMGSAIGLVLGALVAEHYGWRMAFVAVGMPGLALAVALRLWLRDPRRERPTALPFGSILGMITIILSKPSFLLASIGAGIASLFGYVTVFWGPTYFIRSFGVSTVEVAFWGAILIVGATSTGTLLGGVIVDRLSLRWPAAPVLVPALAILAAAPFYWLALAMPDATAAALMFAIPTALAAFWCGPIYALTQNLAPVGMRAIATALLFLILNLIGLTVGPTLTGILSSHYFPTAGLAGGLRAALNMIVVAAFPAAVFLLAAARWVAADINATASKESDGAYAN